MNVWEKNLNLKNVNFEYKGPKIKKKTSFLHFDNFVLKLQTSWAKRVVKSISETASGVSIYV